MAVEAKRGCGFRKLGGLYLVSTGAGFPCDRLPFALDVCPTCSHGLKQARGWTWVEVQTLVGGPHQPCQDSLCPFCQPAALGRAGLIWIGERFYPTAKHFLFEASTLGISRRIKAIPRGFKLGETWVLLAHPKGIAPAHSPTCSQEVNILGAACDCGFDLNRWTPAIFRVFKPERIEKIITQSQSQDTELMQELADKGLTPVVVLDHDPDHQGSCYDDLELEEDERDLFSDLVKGEPVDALSR